MKSYFKNKTETDKTEELREELTEFVREISDTEDDPNRFAAAVLLIFSRSQKARNDLCEKAISGDLSEKQMEELRKYFEDELVKFEEFAEKMSGSDNRA